MGDSVSVSKAPDDPSGILSQEYQQREWQQTHGKGDFLKPGSVPMKKNPDICLDGNEIGKAQEKPDGQYPQRAAVDQPAEHGEYGKKDDQYVEG